MWGGETESELNRVAQYAEWHNQVNQTVKQVAQHATSSNLAPSDGLFINISRCLAGIAFGALAAAGGPFEVLLGGPPELGLLAGGPPDTALLGGPPELGLLLADFDGEGARLADRNSEIGEVALRAVDAFGVSSSPAAPGLLAARSAAPMWHSLPFCVLTCLRPTDRVPLRLFRLTLFRRPECAGRVHGDPPLQVVV